MKRGYVLMTVLLILALLAAGGAYGLVTIQSNVRATGSAVRVELLSAAAEAGAAARLAEVAIAADDAGAALDRQPSTTAWPPPNVFTTPTDLTAAIDCSVESELIGSQEGPPPPGVEVGRGGRNAIFGITSIATHANAGAGGEQAISVGAKLYARAGLSYNP